ncbi:hypothetical protein BGX34_011848 [Mortierella sp. NVP85]|nr:hypothetical protein BGX34_011848 [Mortierella sp. NVP85]
MASNNINSLGYTSTNNTIRKPVYNDSFDQPAEPFECDVSAIYPASNTSILTETELENDDEEDDEEDDVEDDVEEELEVEEAINVQQAQMRKQRLQARKHDSEPQQQGALSARYLEVGTDWKPSHTQYDDADPMDEEEQQYYYQHELIHQEQQQHQHQHHQRHQQQQHLDDEPVGGIARLSTIAEVSELNSLNLTNNRHLSHRNTPPQSGQQVITRDLVLEDLYVEGQDENMDEEIRQRLLANLKPTDILGPLHETHDFKISSLTGTDPDGNPVGPRQHHHYEPERSLIREEGESFLSENALALKREYEAIFPNGAIDSERSGSDLSEDYYQDDEDDGDDFFDDDDDEPDEEEEQFYAMLDMNGGNGNMILGNNIPRKPRALAPPPGSRLPVPGAAIRQNQSPLQSTPAKHSPAPRPASVPAVSATPPPPTSRVQTSTTGLRKPMVSVKMTDPEPLITQQDSESNGMKSLGGILDGLYKEPEFDEHPEESPGAIYAAQVAKELMKEKQGVQLKPSPLSRPSMLRPPSKLPQRTVPDIDADLIQEEEEEQVEEGDEVRNALLKTYMDAPATTSGIPRAVSTRSTQVMTPPKTSSSLQTARLSARTTTTTTTTAATTSVTQASAPSSGVARSSPTPRLAHKASFPSVITSTPSSAASSPRPTTGNTAGREPLSIRTSTPTRSLSASAAKPRPMTMYSTTATERSPVVSRTASPINAARINSQRASVYEQFGRDMHAEQPPNHSASKDSLRGKVPYNGRMPSPREIPEDLVRRPSRERRKHLHYEQGVEVEEEPERQTPEAERYLVAPRKLTVRTLGSRDEHRRSDEQQGYRRSLDRERERGRDQDRELDSSVPASPRTPLSHSPRSGVSSKRSSIYGGHGSVMNGERPVPTFEESSRLLASLNQDFMEIHEKIQKRNGATSSNPPSSSARISTSKRPTISVIVGRERERDREEGPTSSRSSFDGKYPRETKPYHGRSDSFDGNDPMSPASRFAQFPTTPTTTTPRGGTFAEAIGKSKRSVIHSAPITMESGLESGHYNKTPSSTYQKEKVSHSTSNPTLRSRRMTVDPEPGRDRPHGHYRTPSYGTLGRSSSYRTSTQPSTPMVQRHSGDDRYHSGSSGQSDEFSDELPNDPRHGYSHPDQQDHYQYYDRQQPASHHQYDHYQPHQDAHRYPNHPDLQQQQQQQRRQETSNPSAHYLRQTHDELLDGPPPLPMTAVATDSSSSSGESICPAQIRPKELQFPGNVEGEMEESVTLYNRSRRYVRFEILQPNGITISPSEGVIPPGADKRLTVRVAEDRGPGRVVVELDGEWLVPFGVSFK